MQRRNHTNIYSDHLRNSDNKRTASLTRTLDPIRSGYKTPDVNKELDDLRALKKSIFYQKYPGHQTQRGMNNNNKAKNNSRYFNYSSNSTGTIKSQDNRSPGANRIDFASEGDFNYEQYLNKQLQLLQKANQNQYSNGKYFPEINNHYDFNESYYTNNNRQGYNNNNTVNNTTNKNNINNSDNVKDSFKQIPGVNGIINNNNSNNNNNMRTNNNENNNNNMSNSNNIHKFLNVDRTQYLNQLHQNYLNSLQKQNNKQKEERNYPNILSWPEPENNRRVLTDANGNSNKNDNNNYRSSNDQGLISLPNDSSSSSVGVPGNISNNNYINNENINSNPIRPAAQDATDYINWMKGVPPEYRHNFTPNEFSQYQHLFANINNLKNKHTNNNNVPNYEDNNNNSINNLPVVKGPDVQQQQQQKPPQDQYGRFGLTNSRTPGNGLGRETNSVNNLPPYVRRRERMDFFPNSSQSRMQNSQSQHRDSNDLSSSKAINNNKPMTINQSFASALSSLNEQKNKKLQQRSESLAKSGRNTNTNNNRSKNYAVDTFSNDCDNKPLPLDKLPPFYPLHLSETRSSFRNPQDLYQRFRVGNTSSVSTDIRSTPTPSYNNTTNNMHNTRSLISSIPQVTESQASYQNPYVPRKLPMGYPDENTNYFVRFSNAIRDSYNNDPSTRNLLPPIPPDTSTRLPVSMMNRRHKNQPNHPNNGFRMLNYQTQSSDAMIMNNNNNRAIGPPTTDESTDTIMQNKGSTNDNNNNQNTADELQTNNNNNNQADTNMNRQQNSYYNIPPAGLAGKASVHRDNNNQEGARNNHPNVMKNLNERSGRPPRPSASIHNSTVGRQNHPLSILSKSSFLSNKSKSALPPQKNKMIKTLSAQRRRGEGDSRVTFVSYSKGGGDEDDDYDEEERLKYYGHVRPRTNMSRARTTSMTGKRSHWDDTSNDLRRSSTLMRSSLNSRHDYDFDPGPGSSSRYDIIPILNTPLRERMSFRTGSRQATAKTMYSRAPTTLSSALSPARPNNNKQLKSILKQPQAIFETPVYPMKIMLFCQKGIMAIPSPTDVIPNINSFSQPKDLISYNKHNMLPNSSEQRRHRFSVNMNGFLDEDIYFFMDKSKRKLFVEGRRPKRENINARRIIETIDLPSGLDPDNLRVARDYKGHLLFEEAWIF